MTKKPHTYNCFVAMDQTLLANTQLRTGEFTGARHNEWQWHQLGPMQIYTLIHTNNHAGIPPLSFYRLDALPATKPTASKH